MAVRDDAPGHSTARLPFQVNVMISSDVLIVGGGPAGSACAWRLKQKGVNAILIDQADYPRFKPCAGWITPGVFKDLGLEIADYPCGLTTFNSFNISVKGFRFKLPTRQYAIRRFEFDNWLLRRADVSVYKHTAREIKRTQNGFEIDGAFTGTCLVGAGGTRCQVARTFFEKDHPRDENSLIVAMEEEFPYEVADKNCSLWFLENGLAGYDWYVPKTNGYVNVGVGGKAKTLKESGDTLKRHWQLLVDKLERLGLVKNHAYKPVGHSYYLHQKTPVVVNGNAFLVGDAAGLATMDMGEGIGPSIRSGLLAADAIAGGAAYSVEGIQRISTWSILLSGLSNRRE